MSQFSLKLIDQTILLAALSRVCRPVAHGVCIIFYVTDEDEAKDAEEKRREERQKHGKRGHGAGLSGHSALSTFGRHFALFQTIPSARFQLVWLPHNLISTWADNRRTCCGDERKGAGVASGRVNVGRFVDGQWAGASFACHVIEIAFDGSQLINRLCRLSVIDSVRSWRAFPTLSLFFYLPLPLHLSVVFFFAHSLPLFVVVFSTFVGSHLLDLLIDKCRAFCPNAFCSCNYRYFCHFCRFFLFETLLHLYLMEHLDD